MICHKPTIRQQRLDTCWEGGYRLTSDAQHQQQQGAPAQQIYSHIPTTLTETTQTKRGMNHDLNHNHHRPIYSTGWWQLKYSLFSSRKIGEIIQFDEHIFQIGWFNHQPVNFLRRFSGVKPRSPLRPAFAVSLLRGFVAYRRSPPSSPVHRSVISRCHDSEGHGLHKQKSGWVANDFWNVTRIFTIYQMNSIGFSNFIEHFRWFTIE